MTLTLNRATKDWLAINAGTNNCFAMSGISYAVYNKDTGQLEMQPPGGTFTVLNAFRTTHQVALLPGQEARDADQIIALMDYTHLKALNGGIDISMDDITNAHNILYCAPHALIKSTGLTVDKEICSYSLQPCIFTANVNWANSGAFPTTFTPGIKVDGVELVPIPPLDPVMVNPYGPMSQSFTISGLTGDGITHVLCAYATGNDVIDPTPSCLPIGTTAMEANICTWIQYTLGGWKSMNIAGIMRLVEGFLFPDTNTLGFVVLGDYIMAALNYYLCDSNPNQTMMDDANSITLCTFTLA